MKVKLLIISVLSLLLFSSGCAKEINNATKGALAGAALGAGTGAIVGNQTGNSGAGVAIGAGLGAIGGAIAGNAIDQQEVDNDRVREGIARNQELIEENRRLIEELRKRGADVRSSKRGVVINLPDILFEFDRDRLTPEAHRTLDEISDVLRTVKNRPIAVEGHTDSIGSVNYNKNLSRRRATSVANKLRNSGIPSGQMQVAGYGEGAPIATNNTDAGRARNRRVEIIVEN